MIIRAALDLAVQRQLVANNVADAAHARRHQPTKAVARTWNAAELAEFLAAARRQRLYPALHLAAHTGMRRGEIVGLKWSDLDSGTNRLSISRTVQCLGGRPVEFGVKTRTSRRCIDLSPSTVQELARWRRRLGDDSLPHGNDDWMFCNSAGRFLNPESVSQLFDRIVGRIQLPRIRFHDLRPRLAAGGGWRAHQGRHRTPRPRPPSLYYSQLPAPPSRYGRSSSRPVRGACRCRQPVDVYRLPRHEFPGQRPGGLAAGRHRR